MSGDKVVFVGEWAGGSMGIYANTTGSLTKVIDTSDRIDGRLPWYLSIGNSSFDGTYVTFTALFGDGAEGVYQVPVAPVPEPAGVLVLAAVGAGLLRLTRRRVT